MATGPPMALAASTASSGLCTRRSLVTGTPYRASRDLLVDSERPLSGVVGQERAGGGGPGRVGRPGAAVAGRARATESASVPRACMARWGSV